MHHLSKVEVMLQRESNADELCRWTLRKNIDTNEEGVRPLQIATQFVRYIPVRRW